MDNQHRHIKGYRELTQAEINAMNQIKAESERVKELLAYVRAPGFDTDQRWASIAETHLQQGFMALVRSIAKPTTF